MHPALARNVFLIKEHVGLLKAANNYDIYDPETGEVILHCREPELGAVTKILRFIDYKRMTPFDVRITSPEGAPAIRITRGVSIFLSNVQVLDEHDAPVGGFKQKLFSVGGAFDVLDVHDRSLCKLKGKWTGWDFRFQSEQGDLARVTKKWAGIGKELLTSADNYILEIDPSVDAQDPARTLILAAVMCIDMVLKE